MENYLDTLNTQQKEAVIYNDGPSLVIAGAGSGKTRVLTYKIVHLLSNSYDAHRILALTFTNKAAREMKERIAALVGDEVASRLWMGTFHSIFLRILRFNSERIGFKSNFTIYDTADSRSLIKTIIKEKGLDEKAYKASSIQSQISNAKNSLISPINYENDKSLIDADTKANRPNIINIYKTYWNRCKVANAMDFDDILFYMNILLRDNQDILKKYQNYFQYILVDEYQDTNFAQHLIVYQLSKLHNKICVVGDDAQSIYSFRGANIKNILNLKGQFKDLRIFKLEQNYRSTQNIINAANSLIDKNKEQIKKTIFSENSKGSKIAVIQSYSGYEEGYIVANKIIELKALQSDSFNDFAILYRTNAQSRMLEEALRKRNIPYKIYGGLSFYQRKEIKDIISYFRATVNPDDDEAIKRIINYPARGIGETTISKIQKVANENQCSLWDVLSTNIIDSLDVNKGTKAKLNNFVELINSFIELNSKEEDAYTIADEIIRTTRVFAVLLTDNTPENISKQENIQELLTGVKEFVISKEEEGNENITLSNFLSEVSLATDQDSEEDSLDESRVTLMTVHAAKGLEFKNVFIVGVEEDLFPSAMSCDSISGIEEERRLMYVAITRAKINCIITFANTRFYNGQNKNCTKSRFINDIDDDYLNLSNTSESKSEHSEDKYFQNRSSIIKDFRKQVISDNRNVELIDNLNDFIIHSVDELSIDMPINHLRFGKGVITNIEISTDPKIVVKFENVGNKTLLLKFAKFKI